MTRAAPARFPYREHRTMAQVMAAERAAERYESTRWHFSGTPGMPCTANEPYDYGSPFMVCA